MQSAVPDNDPTPIFEDKVIINVSLGVISSLVLFVFILFISFVILSCGSFNFIEKYILFINIKLVAIIQSILFIISNISPINFMQKKHRNLFYDFSLSLF